MNSTLLKYQENQIERDTHGGKYIKLKYHNMSIFGLLSC